MIDDTAIAGDGEGPGWEAPGLEDAPGLADAFIVDIDGFEGPLDLLLALARTQKVDLAKISILPLVEQYLSFHRASADAAAGTRRRLSRHGGVARLPEVQLLLPREKEDPADAVGRGDGAAPGIPPDAAGGHAHALPRA